MKEAEYIVSDDDPTKLTVLTSGGTSWISHHRRLVNTSALHIKIVTINFLSFYGPTMIYLLHFSPLRFYGEEENLAGWKKNRLQLDALKVHPVIMASTCHNIRTKKKSLLATTWGNNVMKQPESNHEKT